MAHPISGRLRVENRGERLDSDDAYRFLVLEGEDRGTTALITSESAVLQLQASDGQWLEQAVLTWDPGQRCFTASLAEKAPVVTTIFRAGHLSGQLLTAAEARPMHADDLWIMGSLSVLFRIGAGTGRRLDGAGRLQKAAADLSRGPARTAPPAEPASSAVREAVQAVRRATAGRGVPIGELAVFFRSMGVLYASGVRVDRALELMAKQSDHPVMATVCRDLTEKVASGGQVSVAMARHPNVFPVLERKLIEVGEMSGRLEGVLTRIGDYVEKKQATTMKVKSALTYPLVLFAMTMVMLVVVPPYLFNGMFQLIKDSGVEIPLLTRIVLAISNTVRSPVFYFAVAVLIGVASVTLPPILRQQGARRLIMTWVLKVPVIGMCVRKIAITRFARSMEVLLNVGVTPLVGLQLSAEASDNPILEDCIGDAINALKGGMTLENSLLITEFFPRSFLQVIAVGEEAGTVPPLMARLADFYDLELDFALETVTATLEPAMLLLMGVVVGIVVVATMQPMLQVISAF